MFFFFFKQKTAYEMSLIRSRGLGDVYKRQYLIYEYIKKKPCPVALNRQKALWRFCVVSDLIVIINKYYLFVVCIHWVDY